MEVALEVTEDLEIGVRFEGSDDCVDFLPEMQYGVIFCNRSRVQRFRVQRLTDSGAEKVNERKVTLNNEP